MIYTDLHTQKDILRAVHFNKVNLKEILDATQRSLNLNPMNIIIYAETAEYDIHYINFKLIASFLNYKGKIAFVIDSTACIKERIKLKAFASLKRNHIRIVESEEEAYSWLYHNRFPEINAIIHFDKAIKHYSRKFCFKYFPLKTCFV